MNYNELMELYNNGTEMFYDDIVATAIYVDEPDKDACSTFEKCLRILSEKGDKKAAAMYCAVVAYDNHADTFSKDTAIKIYFNIMPKKEYSEIMQQEFESIVDYTYYEYLWAAPSIWLAEAIIENAEDTAAN